MQFFCYLGEEKDYRYTCDLLALDKRSCRMAQIDPRLGSAVTPLRAMAWERRLRRHADEAFVGYILRGLNHGFHLGVQEEGVFQSALRNMPSASKNPEVVEEYIQQEVEKGNILGPFAPGTAPKVHINRFGAIPKKHQPGKWRLITDLSFPEGKSVNDAIDTKLCSLEYITVDNVADVAMSLGVGALIAKIDIKSAYRLIPVCPADRKWLGMQWQDRVCVDGMLPFGLQSAPKIFNAVADALEWCEARRGGVPLPLPGRFCCCRSTKLKDMPPCARHAKKNLWRTRCTTSSRKAGRTLSDHYFPRYHHRHHETGAEAASRQTRTAYRSCIRVGIIKAKVVYKEGTRVPYRSITPCNQSYPCRTILYEKGYSIAQCGKGGLPPHTVEHRLPFGHDVVEGFCKQLERMLGLHPYRG